MLPYTATAASANQPPWLLVGHLRRACATIKGSGLDRRSLAGEVDYCEQSSCHGFELLLLLSPWRAELYSKVAHEYYARIDAASSAPTAAPASDDPQTIPLATVAESVAATTATTPGNKHRSSSSMPRPDGRSV